MNTKKKPSELQASYQAMIDNVEEFIVKEGKTLQQAFHAAEQKLDDAKEISKDKIQQASKDLKNNLRLLGEAAENVGEAYKERIKFDLAYVNSSIWDKLQSIAQSNTTELVAFTRTLREKAQTVVTTEHLSAHQEHTQWGSEHALWLAEIEFWKKEQAEALAKLADVEKALKQQSKALIKHAKAIQAHAEMDHKHEEAMKNAEQDPSSDVFEAADQKERVKHQKERKIHGQESESHHALKSQHFKVMAMFNMLYKEIHKAE